MIEKRDTLVVCCTFIKLAYSQLKVQWKPKQQMLGFSDFRSPLWFRLKYAGNKMLLFTRVDFHALISTNLSDMKAPYRVTEVILLKTIIWAIRARENQRPTSTAKAIFLSTT